MAWLLCLLIGVTGADVPPAESWIDSNAFGSVHIVLPENADQPEIQAATLFQSMWKTCTGCEVSVSDAPKKGVNVWIGLDGLPESLQANQPSPELGRDGVFIRTISAQGESSLLLAGGEDKGVLYATYEFFEQAFGVRWLAPGVTHTPPAPESIAPINYQYTPPLAHRTMNVEGDRTPYRLNSPFRYGVSGHSFYNLLPPEEYFAEHPEYYSEINGKRVAADDVDWKNIRRTGEVSHKLAQLCMSNPATAQALAHAIEERAKERPEANLWSICQMDWGDNCQCAECRAIDEREGTPMGSVLTGINRVAELLERDHPDFLFYTYAYTYTRKPPRTLKPRHNVIIQLCNIECDFARPMADPESPVNRAFMEDFKNWAALTNNILVYDYPVNYWRYQMPHPMFPVFGPNMSFYADQKVLGVYQLTTDPVTDGFGFLKQYVLGKLLWNPYADTDALKNEFIDLYYGDAAPFITEFIALSEQTLQQSGIEMGIGDAGGWMNCDYIAASEELFKQAFAAARTREIRERLDLDYVQVQVAALACPPEIISTEDTLVLRRPPSISPRKYVKRLKHFGIEYMGEHRPREEALEYYSGATGARRFTAPLVRMENEAYLVWVVPKLNGSIVRLQDKRSGREMLRGYKSYGVFPGTFQDWSEQSARGEAGVATPYKLVEHDLHHAVIETQLDSGLIVRRTMQLRPGDNPLELELTLTNPTRESLPTNVKLHPEFYCQVPYDVPEIWLEEASGWAHVNKETMDDGSRGHGFLKPGQATRWAFFMPQAGLSLINEFDPAQLDQLFYYYDTNSIAQQVNLELLPTSAPLAPDASRTIGTTYRVSTEHPTAL